MEKTRKGFVLTTRKTSVITVPKQKFFAIKGQGDPNEADFSKRIGVLYSLAYAVRMMPQSGFTPDGYFKYTVYPLEGVWENSDVFDKASFVYTIMIRQPDFVTVEIFEKAFKNAKTKKPHPFLEKAYFCEIDDGLSVQILHIGDYDNEPASFTKMQEFMDNNGFVRNTSNHREIYLSDVHKIDRSKLKTVLRYSVSKKTK
jgi:hypothetical protein